MKITSKILSVVLVLAMALGMFAIVSFAAEPNYTKINSKEELTTGEYVLKLKSGEEDIALGAFDGKDSVLPGESVLDANWTVTVNGDKVKLTDANGNTIAPKSDKNGLLVDANFEWTVTFAEGKFVFGTETHTLAFNTYNSFNKFRAYKVSSVEAHPESYITEFDLYKKDVVTPEPTEPQPTEKPVDPQPTEKPVDPQPTEKPVDPQPTEKPVDPEITEKPTEPEIPAKSVLSMKIPGKTVYFNGKIANGRFLGTTTKASEAVEVLKEEANGGFYLRVKDGKYISVQETEYKDKKTGEMKKGIQIALTDKAETVYKLDSKLGIMKTTVGGTEYYLGSYTNKEGKTFDTISASKASYVKPDNIGKTQFAAKLTTVGGSAQTGDNFSMIAVVTALVGVSALAVLVINRKKFHA